MSYPLDMDDIGFIYTTEEIEHHDKIERLLLLIEDGLTRDMSQDEREYLIIAGWDPDTGLPLDVADPPRFPAAPGGASRRENEDG
jgi:hypothetical protein